MKQSKLSDFKDKNKPSFVKSLLIRKKNNIFYRMYYSLLDHPFIYKYKRTFKYSIITFLSNLVDFLLLFIFVEFLNIFYLLSASIAYIFAIFINFILNKKYTFKVPLFSLKDIFKDFYKYFLVSISGMFITLLFIAFFVEILSINYIISKLIASLIIFGYVILGHFFIFKSSF